MTLTWTDHACTRAQQRGIRPDAIEAVLKYGRCYHVGGDYYALHLGHRDVTRARRRGLRLEPYKNIAIVIFDEHVITVEHVPRIPRHWRRAGCV
jgi:hypothetical protein